MENKAEKKTLVVIGGGAAGFFCAINVAREKKVKVILLEKTNKLLSKVKISGGGRCNVTNACFSISEMSNKYPRGKQFLKKAFHQFFTKDTIEWFEQQGVSFHAEADGRMFPTTNSSQTIIDCLLQLAQQYSVEIRMHAEVKEITKEEQHFKIRISDDRYLKSDFITIACGGYPKSSSFEWLELLGHTIEEPVPSLFTFNLPKHPITTLMGVSVSNVQVSIPTTKLKESGPILITHWGLSGPVILRLSAWGARILQERNWQFPVQINWLPEYNELSLRTRFQELRKEKASQKISGKNHFTLPQRLWEFLCLDSGITEEIRWSDLPSKEQNKLIKNLCTYELEAKGKTTFKEEFVTAGGIILAEVDVQTMMSKKIENLYFAGEILNVDGITGGFNFQNAWTTGYIAAQSIINQSN